MMSGKNEFCREIVLRGIKLSEDDIEKFWNCVNKKGHDDCWEWTKHRTPKGYGQFRISEGKRKLFSAHRISYAIAYSDLDDKLLVCHSCDNMELVNRCSINLHDLSSMEG